MNRLRRDGEMRVADYVLGLMEPNEAAFFERDMRRNPELAREVADWQDRVARMVASPDAATPHAEMQQRIRDEFIDADRKARRSGAQPARRLPPIPWAPLALPAIGFALIVAVVWLFLRA